MERLRRFMYGRYGVDQLGFALMGLYVALYLLASIFRAGWLSWVALAVLAWEVYRMLSRQLSKRRAENDKFLSVAGPLIRKYNVWLSRRRDKEHTYFKCPGCGQQLRAPKGKGKISVTCRGCGATFEKKT